MASKPHVSLSTTQGSPSLSTLLSSSPAGSVPIRAPITADDDSSDFESKTDNAYNDTSSSIDNESDSEKYVSGEEFESASEKLFVGDPDGENPEDNRYFEKYTLSRPFVADPDVESLGNLVVEEEESGVIDEYDPDIEPGGPNLQQGMPIAQLSMDDDEFEELICDEGMLTGEEEGGRFAGIVEVPSIGVLARVGSAPRVKVSDIEEDKEDELFSQKDLLVKDNGVSGSEGDKFAVKDSDNDSISVECSVVGLEAHVEPLVEKKEDFLKDDLKLNEDDKHVVDDSVLVESVKDDNDHAIVPEAHIIEPLVGREEDVSERNSQLDDDAKHFAEERLPYENVGKEKNKMNGGHGQNSESMVIDFNHVSEQCCEREQKDQIAETVNVYDETHESELNREDNIVAELQELEVDRTFQLEEYMSEMLNFSNNTVENVINPVHRIAPELQEEEKVASFNHNEHGTIVHGSVEAKKGSDSEKLQDKTAQQTGMIFESLEPKDIIGVDSMDNTISMNDIRTMDLVANGHMLEISQADISEDSSFGIKDEAKLDSEKIGVQKGFLSDEAIEDLIFGGSEAAKHIMNESEKSPSSSPLAVADDFHDHLQQRIDGQIVPDSDEETEINKEHKEKELFDPAALAALLKAAASAESDGGRITVTSADGRVFSVEHPAGSGSSFDTVGHASQLNIVKDVVNNSISEEEKKLIEKIHCIRVKFLRLVRRLGLSAEDSIVAQVLYRLILAAGGHVSQEFSLESAKRLALQLEAAGKDDLDFCLNILVIGKTGVGKSATINSIFGKKKVMINAFEPTTNTVKEIVGTVNGVRIRVLDTPGLRSPVKEGATNSKILASIKKSIKKFPPDVVLYVDRLDMHARDLNDVPLLASLTNSLTASIWRNAIVTLTHAAVPPPDGPYGSPLSFEMFVARRSHVVQQAISQAVGDLQLMDPSMMHPVSLVENHPSCQKNENGESILPNGLNWRPQLLVLCYSLKILSEANAITKPQNPSDRKKVFGIRFHSLPLPHLVSSLLQSRSHPKLTAKHGGDDVDSDVELLDLSDSDKEDEDADEYDRLPPFKPLKKSQVNKLSKEQRKAYFEEYDYRVKLLQKKQLKEELTRLKESKENGKDSRSDFNGEDVNQEDEGPAAVPVAMPDFILPPSFDSDNPSYRYRMVEPTSQLLVRPVLDLQGWDHDCGYDGVSLERNLAIAGQFPVAFAVQITKDKKEFNIHLDSTICAKHGENRSTMAGFDIQNIGRQLAYILRTETKFKNFKLNKTSAGMCITLSGKNIATGLKIEDQIAVGKRLALVGSAGAVRSKGDTAYGANLEVRLRNKEFPVEQDQSTLGLSLMKWRGDVGLMANLQSQFSISRNSKMAIRVGMNNKQSGQIIIKTNSSELQVALVTILPMLASTIKRTVFPESAARN